jgi:hypothetical protein
MKPERCCAIMAPMPELKELQYPIGRFVPPAHIGAAEREAAIAVLAGFPQQLARALDGLGDLQLDTPYRPGGWTIRQLVHHVADSHLNAYARMRLALTEDWPTVFAYDETAWAKLADAQLPPAVSVKLLESIHLRWVTTLQALVATDWTRGYLHPANGRQQLDTVLATYAWHAQHHLAHIVNCRKREAW